MLTVTPALLDFSNILINTTMELELILFNPSDCDIHFNLGVQKIIHEEGQFKSINLPNNLVEGEIQVVQKSNVLPARSNETIMVKACLKSDVAQTFQIYYQRDRPQIDSNLQLLLPKKSPHEELHPLAGVKANGVHPLICVCDIRSEAFSKTVLGQLFSVNRFNELLAEPAKDRMAFAEISLEDDTFPTDAPPIDLSALTADINFDFGATSAGRDPTLLELSLKNSGVVAVDWSFIFPNEADVEIERWADPGDLTDEQTTRNFILDNHIFGVSPKGGKLLPGQVVHVLLSYSHEFAGPHRLPVQFKLRNGSSRTGKEILINFLGYSVPAAQKFLHLQSINHDFAPINIGTVSPPIQYYRMMNRSSASLDYSIDVSAIEQLNSENMNFDILKCIKASGSIPPGGIEYLEFLFHPLVEIEYELDLPITVDEGRTRMITLRGRGIRANSAVEKKVVSDPRILQHAIPQIPTLPPLLKTFASLSLERVDFGHVPIRAVLRQIVVVTNTTEKDNITALWKIPSVWPEHSIRIVPGSVTLGPGQSQVFKISLQPDDRPRLYDFDLVCEISNDTEMV